MYGLGLLVSPFVATAVAVATSKSSNPAQWTLFYLFPLALSVTNLTLVLVAFKKSIKLIPRSPDTETDSGGRMSNATSEIKTMLKMGNLWITSLFFFFYLGAGMTSAGWVVQYLVTVRSGSLQKVGFVPAGSYGGIFLGRLLLAEPTHRFGERRMLLLYTVICMALQLVFWLVPNLMSSIVMFSIMGFFLGPFFAAGVSVASKSFPKDIQPAALGAFLFLLIFAPEGIGVS